MDDSQRKGLKAGLESFTVTGPSVILESMYREALQAVERHPTQEEREALITRAWQAPSGAEMYRLTRQAISGTSHPA